MSTIDNRVVEMNFDGSKFGSGVEKTLSMLDRLKAALHLDGASKGLEDINAAAGHFNSSPMEQGVGRIAGSFTSMQAVAFGALANIGSKLSSLALNMVKGLTIGPIAGGLDDYHAKLTSVQTIMNATGESIDVVDAHFKELDTYADKTIYNLKDMTGAFAKFTNAGVDMDKSVPAIKGIANMVALAGQGAGEAEIAMYNLSQSIAGGFLSTTDYKSLNLANVATKEWKEQIVGAAVAAGTLQKKGADSYHVVGMKAGTASTAAQLFNDNLAEGWATTDVLMGVLGDYGDTTTKIGKKAQAAAQDVKSFPMMMETLKASVGTGWTDTFEILIGNVEEAKVLFTGLTNSVGGFLGRIGDSRNEMLKGWKDDGGRTALIEGLTDAFWALGAPLAQVGMAFRDVFPAMTGKRLAEITKSFADFMKEIQPSQETLDRLRRTFAGVFAILHIGWTVIKAVAGFLFNLFAGVEEGDKGILKFTATIGDFFVGLDKAISSGKGLNKFFDNLLQLLFKVINPIKDFGQVIGNVFAGLDIGDAGESFGKWITTLLTFGDAADSAGDSAKKGKSFIRGFFDFFKGIASWVGDFVKPLIDNISGAFEGINYDDVMEALQTGLLGGLVVVIKRLGGMFSNLNIFGGGGEGPGFFDNIKEGLDNLTGTLGAMQANLKASMLLKIAAAVAVLAISVVLLAGVDAAGLARATAALTVMFIQLGVAMQVFQKIGTVGTLVKLNLMGAALILIAAAILILAGAVKLLASMSWEELAKGLVGVTVLMGVIIGLSRGLDKAKGAIIRSAFALIIMAAALKLLVGVVKELGAMDLTTMGQGLLGVGALLTGLAIFTRLAKAGPKALAQAGALLFMAMALKSLAGVVIIFSQMSWGEMAKGFAGVSAGLIAIGIAMKFMPKGPQMILTAFGIGKVAAAFGLIALAFKQFKDISWDQIARGMTAIVGSLTVVTLAIKYLPKPSAMQVVSLLALAYAIKQIVSSMVLIGDMDTDQVAKALVVFSAVMGVIVLALNKMKGSAEGAASIAIVAGSLQALETVLSTWGAMDLISLAKGMGALIGVLGIMVVALNLLKTEAAGAAALALVAGALSLLVPVLVTLGAMPLVAIGGALVGLAGMFGVMVLGLKLLQPMIPTLIAFAIAIALLGAAVALAGAGVFLFALGLTALAVAGAAGTAALVAMVSALAGLIPMVAKQIGLGIVALLAAIGSSAEALTKAFVQIVAALLNAIIRLAPKFGQTLLVLLKTGLKVLLNGVPMLVNAGMRLLVGFLKGISDNIGDVVDAAVDIVVNFIDGLSRNMRRIIQSGIDFILSFINGLADGIRDNSKAMGEAGGNLATAMVEGMINGFTGLFGKLKDAAVNLAKRAWEAAKDWLGIESPSKKFMELGKYSNEGFIKGLTGNKQDIKDAVKDMFGKIDEARAADIESIKKNDARLKELADRRKETAIQLGKANEAVAKAYARNPSSTAKTQNARNAEIKREQDAKVRAIEVAEERVRRLNVTYKKEQDGIASLTTANKNIRAEYDKLTKSRAYFKNSLDDEYARLKTLADQHDVVTKKLDDAKKAYTDAKKVRDDYNDSLSAQYGTQEDVNKDTKLGAYVKNLEKQIVDTQQYAIAITELRKRGLNDEMYKELLASGPEAMPFVQELLAGGTGAVKQINTLGSSLDKAAGKLGTSASTSLYQAGVNAAAGLVKGLEMQKDKIEFQMDKIAGYMVNAIKKKLGIKSPSQVFAELGAYSAEGLAKGFEQSSVVVSKSAEGLGQTAIDAMKRTIPGLGDLISGDMDLNPVVTPVLDLSTIKKDASSIGSLLATTPLSVDSSYSNARNASAGYNANVAARAETTRSDEPVSQVVFNQTNNSPKALSPAEIYRNTKNQLSVAKGALTT